MNKLDPNGMTIPVPNLQAAKRLIVTVERADGHDETIEAIGDLQFGMGFFLVPTANGHVGFSLESVRRWEVAMSNLSVMRAQ